MGKRYYVGIDLGGTNIKGGVVDEAGKVLHFESIETEGKQGRDHVLDRIAMLVGKVRDGAKLAKDQIAAVGIGSPGPLDTKRGIIYTAPNLPGWENLHLGEELGRRTGYPVFIENDANAAALAESFAGVGQGTQCMLLLTLGTGIGGGIVIDGKVWHGVNDCGGELGHVSIDYRGRRCNCGSIGCVETYASASNLVIRTLEKLQAGARSSLSQHGDGLECHHIFQAAAAGDAFAQEVVAEGLTMLAAAIATLINIFNPDMVVLFGGMTKAGEQLFAPVREEVRKRAFAMAVDRCRIVRAKLGDEAGVIGAAVTALQRMQAAGKA
jgi:glucokinase